MANKKYNEFPAGTYDTSKIFLQADASTGELTKVNLPAASSRRVLSVKISMEEGNDVSASANFSGTDLHASASYTVDGIINVTYDSIGTQDFDFLIQGLFFFNNLFITPTLITAGSSSLVFHFSNPTSVPFDECTFEVTYTKEFILN